MFKKINQLKTLIVFALAFGALSLINPSDAFAATKTWVGTDAINNEWSLASNWSPSGVPVNGDDLIFPNSGTAFGAINDIQGFTANTITFNGTGTSSMVIHNEHPLTINGDITSNIVQTSLGNAYGGIYGDVILGGDVVATNVKFYDETTPTTGTGDTINLNGHELTLRTNSNFYEPGDNNSTYSISDLIVTGAGVLTIDVRNAVTIFLNAANDYSGVTNLISGQTLLFSTSDSSNSMFGTSTINVSSTASLGLDASQTSTTWTFANPINIAPAAVGQSGWMDAQLSVRSNLDNQVINIPNITLNGNAKFSLIDVGLDNVVVNLAGIQYGAFCVQYLDENNTQANQFQNGPPACVITNTSSVADVPGAPSAGDMVKSPIAMVAAGVFGIGLLGFGVKRGLVFVKARR